MKQRNRKSAWRIELLAIMLIGSFVALGSSSRAQLAGYTIGEQVSPVVDLWLHSGDDINSPNVTIMKRGQPATVTGASGFGWYPLDYQGLTGWAAGKYLQPYTGTPAPTDSPTTTFPGSTPAAPPGQPGQQTPTPATTAVPTSTVTPMPVPQIVTATIKAAYPYIIPTTPNSQGIMLGMFKGGNLRAAPTLNSAVIKGWGYGRKVMV